MSGETYARLRAAHPELVYEQYTITETPGAIDLEFTFTLANGPTFRPTLRIPRLFEIDLDRRFLENLAFHIGLVELISYWKAACPPVIRLRAGRLNEAQEAWWRDLLFHGLGEFFYLNHLAPDPADFVQILNESTIHHPPMPCAVTDRNLIPVGGGKDSLVTLRLLQPQHDKNFCFLLNTSRSQQASAELFGYWPARTIVARRTLDPALLELNRSGYLNGHTPFSALLGFTTILAAALHGAARILLSNESSASEPTVPGSTVNHQYSKSWRFEQAFDDYVRRHLTSSIDYFSLLRPWNELRIAQRIAADPGSLAVFRSCNVGSKQDRWCGTCAKCLFVDILLAPFVPAATRQQIFGGPVPLDRPELRPLLDQLIGAVPVKPFECIGTVEEVRAALTLASQKESGSALLQYFREIHPTLAVPPERIAALLAEFNPEHRLPANFAALLKD